MKILMLSCTFPYPPTRGGTQVRTFNLLKHLSQRHSITLVTQRTEDVTDEEIGKLRQWVSELVLFDRPPEAQAGKLAKVQRFGNFLRQGIPPNVLSIYSPQMQQWISEAVETGLFEAITCEHSVNEIYVQPHWPQQLRTVVNIHSSVYGTCKNHLETGTSQNSLRDQLNLPLLRQYEQNYCSKFAKLVVTTVEDRRQIEALSPDSQISVIPNGVDLTLFPKRSTNPDGHKLVFIGAMDNAPNIDAARYLSLEVFPEIQKLYPDATLSLVGARPVPEVLELGERPGITVTGRVPAVVEYLHQATVCAIPMRAGYGIKNKTLEAMAAGTPVVGSDRALEGLSVDGGEVPVRALRANRIEDYVVTISRLFTDPSLRKRLSQNARQLVETQYTWERAGEAYEQVLLSSPKGSQAKM